MILYIIFDLHSRWYTPVKHVQGAVDYLEWMTRTGTKKSTNRIDDILVLTPKGEDLKNL
jgi:hypothetical protein